MDQFLERFRMFFHLICQASAFSLTIYWIHMYTLNKDLCTVDFKTFNPGNEDFYPILSLCFSDAASDKMFSLDNYSVNQSTYIEFLEGEHFNASLLKIDYEHIAMNISDYVISEWMKPSNAKKSIN